MQEPYSPPVQHRVPPFPEQEHLKCPRCDSDNTKFCYYNNYNLSQPRHFCKACRRYWTKGGTLRNIPVGGGSRKNAKRSSGSSPAASSAKRPAPPSDSEVADKTPPKGDGFEGRFGDFTGATGGLGFDSLLGPTEGEFGGFIDGEFQMGGEEHHFGDLGSGQSINVDSDEFLAGDNGGDWSGGSNGWPDLSMYTPGSTFL